MIITVVAMLVLSAFFSGMEIAFTSANKLRLELEKKQSSVYNYIASLFQRNKGQYISTILVGNNIALVVYSISMSLLIQHFMGGASYFVETLISTLVIIFTAEFLPKAAVKANPNFYLRIFAVPLLIFYMLFYPLSRFSTILSTLILKICGIKIDRQVQMGGFDKIDLAALVENSNDAKSDLENENEIKMFQNALDFSDLRVRDCMVPRIDIEAVEDDCSLEELRKLFIKTHFSRIPVYHGTIDSIIGYVNSRQLFTNPDNIAQMLRETIYVPESAMVQKLLSQFIKQRKSLAIVIDEFGGTAGMITIEDILEEIFGEIEDEHDSDYLVEKQISDREFILSGRLEIDYLNQEFGLDIPESDHYDTLAGYILFTSENLPKVGDVLYIGKLKIKILRASSSRISMVELTIE